MKTVTFDSIIFGLQKYGGISNYWNKIIEYTHNSGEYRVQLLLPNEIMSKTFELQNYGNNEIQFENEISTKISRYCTIKNTDSEILHTSYYRVPHKPVSKFIVTVYDFIYERFRFGPANWVHRYQKNNAIRKADKIICISEFTRQDILKYCPNINPDKIYVIPLGVDRSIFYPDYSNNVLQKMQIVFVGLRQGYKRFDLVVEALRNNKLFNLGIVGPPLRNNELKFITDALGSNWYYYGSVSDSGLREIYSNAHCFVFPSDYEGFGLPILEAMACGCPVVCSQAASLPEVGGNAAFYVTEQTPNAYLNAFIELKSKILRDELTSLGSSRVLEYSWESTCTKTLNLYSDNH